MPTTAAEKPEVTPAMVLAAFRRIDLPVPHTIVQPGTRTLVGLDTIFHTDTGPLTRTVTLLGQKVRLAITPSRFVWSYDDGSSATTDTPGAAYPARTIVHRYARAHITVHPHVRVTWSATYTVDGGASQNVPGTVSTDGQEVALRVAEAVPALSGVGR